MNHEWKKNLGIPEQQPLHNKLYNIILYFETKTKYIETTITQPLKNNCKD